MGKVKLFGFQLTMTSALLLFIGAVSLIFAGFVGLYTSISTFQTTEYFPTAFFFVYLFILFIGLYILIQTVRFRR